LVENCLEDRVPPGCGEFDIARLLQTLDNIGGLRRVGPEIFSAALDGLTAAEIGRFAEDPSSIVWMQPASATISAPLTPTGRRSSLAATREHAEHGPALGSTARAHL
jgi:hypothetical protein